MKKEAKGRERKREPDQSREMAMRMKSKKCSFISSSCLVEKEANGKEHVGMLRKKKHKKKDSKKVQ